jgi:fluoride exporter
MTPVLFVLAASAGALLRHGTHQLVRPVPALLVVNIVGSGLLGFIIGADFSRSTTTVLGAAFCGSLTTYSGYALELRRLSRLDAVVFAAVSVGATCLAAKLASSW